MSVSISHMSADAKAGWLAAENDTGVPYGLPPGEEANGASTAVDDAALTPTDAGSDGPQEDEQLAAELADLEAQREVDKVFAQLAASRDRVLAQAGPAGASDVAVRAQPTYDGRGRDLVYWVFIHMGGKVYSGHSEDLASAETQALLRASIADVAARKGVTA